MNASRVGLLLLLLGFLMACSRGSQEAKNYVEFSIPTLGNPFWQKMADGARAVARTDTSIQIGIHAGDEDTDARSQSAALRASLQRSQIKALVLGPTSDVALVPIVGEYTKRGIPVILVDSRLDSTALQRAGGRVARYFGSQNEGGGELAAKYLGSVIGSKKNNILLIGGSPEHETARARAGGFRRAASSEWVVMDVTANWSRSEANAATRAALAKGHIAGIFAASDEMALGAADALHAANVPKTQWPVIVGFDATPDARKAMADSLICASVAQNPEEIGRRAALAADSLVHGNTIPQADVLLPVTLVADGRSPICQASGGH